MDGLLLYTERFSSPTAAGNERWQRIQRPRYPAHLNPKRQRRFGAAHGSTS